MISKDDIEHLKDLARVEFGEKETNGLAHDLGKILEYVDVLRAVDVSGVSETMRAIALKNVMREDVAHEDAHGSENVATLVAAFSEKKGDLLKVKSIL